MHYYKRNLGDYSKKAGRLSMLQHGSYTLLIDACYDREQFPTLEDAIEWTWASSQQEIEAVEFVLRKFFVLENGVYIQKRIQEELAAYAGKAKTNKRIAEERETKRKEEITNRAPVVNEPPPNHKPLTNNHKPLTNINPAAEDTVNQPEQEQVKEMPPAVALSIAFRAKGVKTQPHDPRLIALAEQGVTADLVNSACDEARASKPNETIGVAYVLAILERWAKVASAVQVTGAQMPNARASPGYQTATEKAKQWADRATGKAKNESHRTIIDIN